MPKIKLMASSSTLVLILAIMTTNMFASTWQEFGDAPDSLPGQVPIGTGSLTRIEGDFWNVDSDVDLYCIYISDPANFTATQVAPQPDISLWLFDASGLGIAHHGDDDLVFSPPTVPLTSLSGTYVPNPGLYVLGVSPSGRDAVDGLSLEMWRDFPAIERMPDGPGAGGTLAGWNGVGFGQSRNYSIDLVGAEFATHVPEPGSGQLAWVLLSGVAMLLRRVRAA